MKVLLTNDIELNDYVFLIKEQRLYIGEHERWMPQRLRDVVNLMDASFKGLRIGELAGRPCYAIELPFELAQDQFVSLRSQMHLLLESEWQLLSRALQLLTWYQQHQFCGSCGHPTEIHPTESGLYCRSCTLLIYPRINPCMMCLIVKGDYCLLAHHSKHPKVVYSTLAGFVEAGETLEQCLHREVMEEVGLSVKNLRYFNSQSWPFPQQLMLGYFADYDSGEILIDENEIEDARWFHYSELPTTPPELTLSGQLIKQFVKERLMTENNSLYSE